MPAVTTFEFSSAEEVINEGGNQNCKFCKNDILCSEDHLRVRHINFAIYYECSGSIRFTIPCFCAALDQKSTPKNAWLGLQCQIKRKLTNLLHSLQLLGVKVVVWSVLTAPGNFLMRLI
ncbi:unnamed protein product [Merluccius merluccius]